jgi:hypothetical protein
MESLKRRFRISINDINDYEYNIIIKKIIKKLYNTQEHYDNKTKSGCNYKSFYDSIKARTPREDYDRIMTYSSENGSLNKNKLIEHIKIKKEEFWLKHDLCLPERNTKSRSLMRRRSSSPEKIDLKGGTRKKNNKRRKK